MMVSSRSSPRCWASPANTELLEAKAKRFAGEQREATSGVRKPCPAWVDELRDRSEQTTAVDEGRHKRAAPGIGVETVPHLPRGPDRNQIASDDFAVNCIIHKRIRVGKKAPGRLICTTVRRIFKDFC
jgi:hypothetical protein